MADKKTEEIEQKVAQYRQRLIRLTTTPPPSKEDRQKASAERLMESLARVEQALGKGDHKRLKTLLRAAQLKANEGDLAAVYGYCAEAAALCRFQIRGPNAHPLPSVPPIRPFSSLPPNTEDRED